jgi:predicted metal-binding protein
MAIFFSWHLDFAGKAIYKSFYEHILIKMGVLSHKSRGERRKAMEKVAVVGCGAYMDSGYGCPGEWRCLKAAALGEGNFDNPSQVVSFVKCECPGRSLGPNVGMAIKLSEIKPDKIYLTSCLANAKPGCPYTTADEMAEIIAQKTGIEVIQGTHDYH